MALIVVGVLAGLPVAVPVPVAASLTCPPGASISYGQTIRCSTTHVDERDAFTFDGRAGEVVLVRMASVVTATGVDLRPVIRIEDPLGGLVCEQDTGGRKFGETTCRLVSTGSHRVVVWEGTSGNAVNPKDWTGDYHLHLQSTNEPGGSVALGLGETVEGTIAFATETDAFTVAATDADRLVERLSRISSTNTIQARLFSPAGTLACPSLSTTFGGETSCEINESGTFTVIVSDLAGDTGGYSLYVQRLNDPVGALPYDLGTGVTGHLSKPSEMDAYVFDAVAGDVIVARQGPNGATAPPHLRVFGPDGATLCSEATSSTTSVVDALCVVGEAGRVAVFAAANGVAPTGGYSLFVQSVREPSNTRPVVRGAAVTGHLARPTNFATHTFEAAAGERMLIRVGETHAGMNPEVRLYGPTGSELCRASSAFVADMVCLVDKPGRQTILAGTIFGSGGYGLYVDNTGKPAAATPLEFGVPVDAQFSVAGEADAYWFNGRAGQLVTLDETGRDGSTINGALRIFGPDGSLVCGPAQHNLSCRLASAGTHHVFMYDIYSYVGGYRLTAQTPGLVQAASGGATHVTEDGVSDTYTIALTTKPSATVTVTLTPDPQVTVSPSSVTFTTSNWVTPVAITIRAVDDQVVEAYVHEGRVEHAVSSTDADYDRIPLAPHVASIVDNEASGIALLQTDGSTDVAESGGFDTYSVVLTKPPARPVTVAIRPDGQVTASAQQVSFTTTNWDVPKPVEVRAVDDAFDEPSPHTGAIAHAAESLDAAYDGVVAPLSVRVADDDLTYEYFALGDSVASGHGLDDEGPFCKQNAARSYPGAVVSTLGTTRTVDFHHLACSGTVALTGGPEPDVQVLARQVDAVMRERTATNPALVSLSIGADQLELSDARDARPLLCESGRQPFEGLVQQRTSAIRDAVLVQARRLLSDPLVTVVVTEQYQALNTSPSYLDDPAFVGGVKVPCNRVEAYERGVLAVQMLNAALASVRGLLAPGEAERFTVAAVETTFFGREGAAPGCGVDPPLEDATWIQHPGRGFTSTAGGDCFHANDAGTRAIADAVLIAREPVPPDVQAPACAVGTASGAVLLAPPLGQDRVAGSAADGQSGVVSVTVTFVPDPGAGAPTRVNASRQCQSGGKTCTWTAPPPSLPGRYTVTCVATDRALNRSAPASGGPVVVL